MKYILIILLSIISIQGFAAGTDQPIIVKLATESQLIPLYLAKIEDSGSGFDSGYVAQLEKILRFDLDHNGMTQVVKDSPEKIALASKISFDRAENLSNWKSQNVFYVIKARVADKKLYARMFTVNSNGMKMSDDLSLTGNIAQDRRTIHKLADMMHKSLFGTNGVASTRFLYTIRTRASKDNASKWVSEVWEADYDGANSKQITRDGSYAVMPTYMPPKAGYTSGSFFYVSYQTSQPKIFMSTLKDGSGMRFSKLKANQLMPAISRQRDKMAFISDVTGNPDLFIQEFNPESGAVGKPQQIFSAKHATQGSPTFSPDGQRIAFVSNKDGAARIYVMPIPAAGSKLKDIKPTLLTKHGKESTAPAWSPDGSKLAYCSLTNGVRQIWIYDFGNKEERQVTQGPGHKENPTWAPNSLHLIFNSSSADTSELYLVNLNQPESVKISSGYGEKRFPNWEPR